ncbi:MAG: NmrA family NAD(P)-binding protein [Bacteroidia bacterium]|nr:NmrA family NAD(P)-binding protein [Bacteroidia bacterium]
MEKILITGATGNVGLATLKLLESKNYPGVEVVAAVRDIERAKKIEGIANCNFCQFEFDEPTTYDKALEGVTRIVLIRPNQVSDVSKYIFPFLAKAEQTGVKHIVFISIVGAERNRIYANHRTENHFKKLNIPSTILRPSLYMQNLSTLHRHDIQYHDKINIPGGTGLVNYIDVRDVAEAIVTVLMNSGHENQAYDITGPEVMDFYQIAKIFSTELEREIKYTRPSAIRFVRQKLVDKKQLLYVLTLSLLYNAVRSGKMNYTNDVFRNITGHDPRHLADFVHEYREYWLKTDQKKKSVSLKKRLYRLHK